MRLQRVDLPPCLVLFAVTAILAFISGFGFGYQKCVRENQQRQLLDLENRIDAEYNRTFGPKRF